MKEKRHLRTFSQLDLERFPQSYFKSSSTSPILVICIVAGGLVQKRGTLIFKSVLFIRKTKRPACLVTWMQWNSWVHPKFPWHLTQTEGKCLAEKQRQTLSVENPFCAHVAAGKLCWVMQLFWGQWCFCKQPAKWLCWQCCLGLEPSHCTVGKRRRHGRVFLWKIWIIQMSARTDINIWKPSSPTVPTST